MSGDRRYSMKALQVGGFTPLTTIDYPGELAAVVFCQGCPWRCRYCQNGGLLSRQKESSHGWSEILGFLERRRGLLDAVVFSGGEPTLQQDLGKAMVEVRDMGFKVGLHTAGCYPQRLASVLPQVDWVGLDIKTLPEDYPALTGAPDSGRRAWDSLECVLTEAASYEVRVTLHEALLPLNKLKRVIRRLAERGVRRLALPGCRADDCLDPSLGPSRRMTESPELQELLAEWDGQIAVRT